MERRHKTWNEAQRKNEGKEGRSRNWGGNKPRSEQRGRKRQRWSSSEIYERSIYYSAAMNHGTACGGGGADQRQREKKTCCFGSRGRSSRRSLKRSDSEDFTCSGSFLHERPLAHGGRRCADEQGGNTDGKHEADGHLIPPSWSQLNSIIKSSRLNAVCCVLYFKHQENQQQTSWTHVCASVLWKDLQLAPTWPLTPSESADFCWVVYLMTPCKGKKLSQQTCAIRGHTSAFFYIWHRGRLLTPTPSGSKLLTTAVFVTRERSWWLWRKWRRDFIFRLRLWVGGNWFGRSLSKTHYWFSLKCDANHRIKNCKQHKKGS